MPQRSRHISKTDALPVSLTTSAKLDHCSKGFPHGCAALYKQAALIYQADSEGREVRFEFEVSQQINPTVSP